MDTNFINKMNNINIKMENLQTQKQVLLNEFMFNNLDSPWEDVLKSIASVDKISAIKLYYEYLGTSLKQSKEYIDKLCK